MGYAVTAALVVIVGGEDVVEIWTGAGWSSAQRSSLPQGR
jgi:hypothetical protein